MRESPELSMSSPFKICVDVVLKPCLLFFSHDTAGHQVRTLTFKLLLFVKKCKDSFIQSFPQPSCYATLGNRPIVSTMNWEIIEGFHMTLMRPCWCSKTMKQWPY